MSKDINVRFSEAVLKVGELTVDPQVQRSRLSEAKVRRIYANFNPDALGVITVSLRKDMSYVVLDGMHRVEAVRRLTDNTGTMSAHVLTGLALAEEAEIFLDLNYSDKPTIIERYRVSVVAKDELNTKINDLVHAYGYTVSNQSANGHINAVNALRYVYELPVNDGEPNRLQLTLIVVGKAWGNSRHATQAPILVGLGRLFSEYGSQIDLDHLVGKMKGYRGGPQGLLTAAQGLSTLRRSRVAMGVAEILVEEYNKGKAAGSKKALAIWRHRV